MKMTDRASLSKKVNRPLASVAATLAMAMILAACAGGGEGTPQATDDEAAQAGEAAAGADGDASQELAPEVREAAEWAEANQMLFVESREEILRRAEEIGDINILISINDYEAVGRGFQEAYPQLNVVVEEITGTDAYQRFVMEAEAGVVRDWDVASSQVETYDDITPLLAPYDILGMAEVGILDIPIEMIDTTLRYTVGVASQIGGLGYNVNLVDEADLPTRWEDLLEPDFRGRFVLDIRPTNLTPMPACWGEEATYEYAAALAEQDPQWVRGNTDALTRIQTGEAELMVWAHYHSGMRAVERDPDGGLAMALIEPIPVRTAEAMGVFNEDIANNPYAALLFLEWMAGDDAQLILDADPLKSSIHANVGRLAELVEDREICEVGTSEFGMLGVWSDGITEAFGFPTADG